MNDLPWQNRRMDTDMRREILEKAYKSFISNPFFELLSREAEERERTGVRLLLNPEFSGEKLKFFQGETQAWSEVPGLARRIYAQEDSLIEFDPDPDNTNETNQMPGS